MLYALIWTLNYVYFVSSLSTAYVILYNSQNEVSTRECVGEKNRGSLMLKTEGYWKIDSDVCFCLQGQAVSCSWVQIS